MQTKCTGFYMHLFNVTRLLTYLLRQFLIPIKYSLKKHIVIRKQAYKLTAPCTLGMSHCTTFQLGNTSSTGPDL